MDAVCTDTILYRPGSELALAESLIYYLAQEESVILSEELKSFAGKIRITKIVERSGLDQKKIQAWVQSLIADKNSTVLLGESILQLRQGREIVRLIAELVSSLSKREGSLPFSFLLPDSNARGASELGLLSSPGTWI